MNTPTAHHDEYEDHEDREGSMSRQAFVDLASFEPFVRAVRLGDSFK